MPNVSTALQSSSAAVNKLYIKWMFLGNKKKCPFWMSSCLYVALARKLKQYSPNQLVVSSDKISGNSFNTIFFLINCNYFDFLFKESIFFDIEN